MHELDKLRREIRRILHKPGERPDPTFNIKRRIFLRNSSGLFAGAAALGWLPIINTLDIATAATGKPSQAFRFAWISDTHLYPKDVNERFVEKTVRAIEDVRNMKPGADFLIFGGDLAQLGDPVELQLGQQLLNELKLKRHMIPGEHDWYLDMGETWNKQFGESPWKFDHKGVRFIGLDTVSHAPDYWSATKMSPKERMAHMSVLDGTVAGPWAGLGDKQLKWLQDAVSDVSKDTPLIIISHNPLYEYYPPWNFWVRDWREVHEILSPYKNVTNLHGHTHQPLYNEIGNMRSIGMLATSWPWPYAPEGVPKLTKAMTRADPGDHFDGVGWDELAFNEKSMVDNRYVIWPRKPEEVLATAPYDAGTGDNHNQELHRRIADRMWPY